MRWSAARRAAAAVVGLALLAACSPDEPSAQAPGATVGTAAPTTTTINPYAVPAVIDAAYVNRVLAGLDAAVGDVTRQIARTGTVLREAYDQLRAIYGTDWLLQLKIDSYQADLVAGPIGLAGVPGNKVSHVQEIISSSTGCIYARVDRDYTAVFQTPNPSTRTQWIAIRLLDRSRDPLHLNSIGWAYIYEGFERGFVQPSRNPCIES